ncbi:arabinose transporter [Acetobacter sp. LMG 32666]|uniref:arabinose transporter n=1 Tax=Acetobacter sp. LMG 32666 TaxID=2959295 RepID=UPI0030C7A270
MPSTPITVQDKAPHLLVWLAVALFLSYLAVAMSMPTTSVYVATSLHMGNALAGLAVGVAFVSTIITRGFAGRFADHKGGKRCMLFGLVFYTLSGALSAMVTWMPAAWAAFAMLMVARLTLGLGESLTVVGLLAWGIGLMGHQRSGRVLSVVGMGMYGSLAAGSPVGLALYNQGGYALVALACLATPLVGFAMAAPVVAVPPHGGDRQPISRIINKISDLGLVVFFQGIGFAAIGAFMPLMFVHRHWPHAAMGLTFFGLAFVLVRILCSHLPDRLGGARVAFVSMVVETCGQLLLWQAPTPNVALAGAFLTGCGCSMIFPAMGVEVVRRVAPQMRGTAMGGFAAFQDLAYGATGPLTGLLAEWVGDSAVFMVGGLAGIGGLVLSARLAWHERAAVAAD